MSTSPPSRGSGQSDSSLKPSQRPVPGSLGDNALAFNEIQVALSNILSNLGKLVPVEREHVVPPAIAAFVHLIFLMLIHQPIENVISAAFFILLLTSTAWPVWTTLKLMDNKLEAIDEKMDALQHSLSSVDLAAPRHPTVDYVPMVHPVFSDTVEEAPQWKTLEPNAQAIEQRVAPQPFMQDEPVEEPEAYMTSVIPEHERDDELPAILDQTDPNSAALDPTASDKLPAAADKPDSTPTPVGPYVITDSLFAVTRMQNEQNVDNPTVSISPVASEPVARVEQAIGVSVEQSSRQPEPSFDHWSSTLLEIKLRLELFASSSLQRLPQSNQREPVDLVSLRRIALRLLMYCASLSTADFASPNGFLGPPTEVPYYPTGDLGRDRSAAFTTALNCIAELMDLLTGWEKTASAAPLTELAQALNDLGLHEYASSVSGFALEILRDLYAVEPDRFRPRVASVQSLRANIFVDLRQNDDAACAAEEAVTILKEHGETQTELIYAMLSYAVLLGSIGRGEGAAAVAFELMGYIDDPTNIRPGMILVSSLCRLCVSNACIEFDVDLALSEADKAIETSRGFLDTNSEVVLAGALLTKSKILSFKGQNEPAYSISAEAVTLFRSASVDRHVFSLLLAHALSTHSHQLSEANIKSESYSTLHDAVELWQTLQISAPVATKRPLAWALFELAKYRHQDPDKQTLRNELQIAELAVNAFRDVSPSDYAGLADALYLCGRRMLELDNNSDAASCAEESVQYFREARDKSSDKYTVDLIFSLSLASSCLACTERSADALEYAKQAVGVHRERQDNGNAKYDDLLRKLLTDVVYRFMEMGRQQDALPWMQELEQLGMPGDTGNFTAQLARPGGKPRPKNDADSTEQSSFWTDASYSTPKLATSSEGARTSTPTLALQLDKGNEKEVTPSAEPSNSAPGADAGKVIFGNPFSPSSNAPRLSLEEDIPSLTVAAMGRRDALLGMGDPYGSGNNNDLMSSLLSGMGGVGGPTLGGSTRSVNEDPLGGLLGTGGMGGRTLGGPIRAGNNDRLSRLLGDMGSMGGRTMATPSSVPPTGPTGRPLGSPIQQTAWAPPPTGRAGGGRMSGMGGLESLLGGLGGCGPGGGLGGRGGFDPGMFGPEFFGAGGDADGGNNGTTDTGTESGDDIPRSGTWSGTGIQSNLSDISA